MVNPVSGAGRGLRAARELLGPCLEASGAKHDVTVTREPGEAQTIAASIDIDAYDTLVVVGGDGTMHEALQGLCGRPDADRRAADLAFAVVPTVITAVVATIITTVIAAIAVVAAITDVLGPGDEFDDAEEPEETDLIRTIGFGSRATDKWQTRIRMHRTISKHMPIC